MDGIVPASESREAAFAALVRANEAALARLARAYAPPAEREDLRQEMLLQLWRSFEGFEGRSRASTWLYRVALNTALTHRRKARPATVPLDAVPEPGDAGAPGEPLALLEAFLATLDPVQRAVLLLDLEGLDRAQVADVLGLTPNAVAIRMTRLRQAFEARFGGEG